MSLGREGQVHAAGTWLPVQIIAGRALPPRPERVCMCVYMQGKRLRGPQHIPMGPSPESGTGTWGFSPPATGGSPEPDATRGEPCRVETTPLSLRSSWTVLVRTLMTGESLTGPGGDGPGAGQQEQLGPCPASKSDI